MLIILKVKDVRLREVKRRENWESNVGFFHLLNLRVLVLYQNAIYCTVSVEYNTENYVTRYISILSLLGTKMQVDK